MVQIVEVQKYRNLRKDLWHEEHIKYHDPIAILEHFLNHFNPLQYESGRFWKGRSRIA